MLTLEYLSVTFNKVTSLLNELSFLTLLWGRFEVPIRLSLFYLICCYLNMRSWSYISSYYTFKNIFYLFPFLTMETPYNFLYLFKNSTLVQSKFNLKVDKTFYAMIIEHWLIKRKIKLSTQLYLKNNLQIIGICTTVN